MYFINTNTQYIYPYTDRETGAFIQQNIYKSAITKHYYT